MAVAAGEMHTATLSQASLCPETVRGTAAPQELHNAGRVHWVSGPPEGPPAYAGVDFIIVREGKIAAVYLFFDSAAA